MIASEAIITILRATALLCLLVSSVALAQDAGEEEADPVAELSEEQQGLLKKEITKAADRTARGEEAALNEDPEAQRRAQLEEAPMLRSLWNSIQFYGSVRLHAINIFNEEKKLTDFSLGDGASRFGVRGELPLGKKWWLLGRAEGGFDVLDTFTPKAGDDDKNGVGVYNANTDGGSTGTGRADDVLQARVYTNSLRALRTYGEAWYAALVLADLENIYTTDQNKYVNGRGAELYIQWQFKDR